MQDSKYIGGIGCWKGQTHTYSVPTALWTDSSFHSLVQNSWMGLCTRLSLSLFPPRWVQMFAHNLNFPSLPTALQAETTTMGAVQKNKHFCCFSRRQPRPAAICPESWPLWTASPKLTHPGSRVRFGCWGSLWPSHLQFASNNIL